MKVIVGSSSLWPTPSIASAVLTIMVSNGGHYAVRSSKDGKTASGTEELAMKVGERIGVTVTPWSPSGQARASTYYRDNSMVEMADEVFAFFAPSKLMEGGTGHVVYAALRREIAVHIYELDDDGQVREVAADEGLYQQYMKERYP